MPSPDLPPRRKRSRRRNGFVERVLARYRASDIEGQIRHKKRKPPESGLAVPAEPPKGPLPKQGGAEAPLSFD